MSSSKAKTGDIAAKAGASTGGHAAKVEADNTKQATGKAELAGDADQKPAESAPQTGDKAADFVADVVKKAAEVTETVVKGAAELEKAKDTQKIKILRSHPGYGYVPGETAELTPNHVETLVGGGFAELITESQPAE